MHANKYTCPSQLFILAATTDGQKVTVLMRMPIASSALSQLTACLWQFARALLLFQNNALACDNSHIMLSIVDSSLPFTETCIYNYALYMRWNMS